MSEGRHRTTVTRFSRGLPLLQLPLTITSSSCGANCNMGGQRYTRADVVPGVSASMVNPSATHWFDKAAFAPQAGPFGTTGKNTIWGPGLQHWDLTKAKRFAFPRTAGSSSAASCSTPSTR